MRFLVMKKQMFVALFLLVFVTGVALVYSAGQVVQTAAQATHKYPIYSVETGKREVALTINCAWDNTDIPQLLEILSIYDVTATFFVVGDWCDKYPESVKAIYDAGHEIGSHSNTHADMTKLGRDGIAREIQDSAAKIEAITGEPPILFRPPSGSYNTTVVEIIEELGFYPIQWDCDSVDYKNPSAADMQARIMKTLRSGSIILFHSGAQNTPGALPQIIEEIQNKGYKFVPVSKLIYQGDYSVDHTGRQFKASA